MLFWWQYPHLEIIYHVHSKVDVLELATLISEGLLKQGTSFPKTVVYVRTYTDCFTLYGVLKNKLGANFTEPPGYPNLSKYRLIDMFSRAMTNE